MPGLPAFRRATLTAILVAACVTAAHGQTQMELNRQAGNELQEADRKLNDVYRRLMAVTAVDWRPKLRQAQLTWISFRDQECEFETISTVGGSIHGMMVANCRTRITLERVTELERLVNCQEGDLSCPPVTR